MGIGNWRELLCAGAVLLLLPASASAVTCTEKIEIAPPLLPLAVTDGVATLQMELIITHSLSKEVEVVARLTPPAHELGVAAPASFEGGETSKTIALPSSLPSETCAAKRSLVPIRIGPLPAVGLYKGRATVIIPNGTVAALVDFEVKRLTAAFSPQLNGVVLNNNAIEFRPIADARADLRFSIASPDADRELQLEILPTQDEPEVRISPTKMSAKAGSAYPVEISLVKFPEGGRFSGNLVIRDEKSQAQKEFGLVIEPQYLGWGDIAWLVGLVLAGAVLSYFLSVVVPRVRLGFAQQRNLAELSRLISEATEEASATQIFLLVELRRLRQRRAAIWVFSLDGEALWTDLANLSEQLKTKIDVAARARGLREVITDPDRTPPSMAADLIWVIEDAELLLLRNDVELARKKLDEVDTHMTRFRDVERLKASLVQHIRDLPKVEGLAEDYDLGHHWIREEIVSLKEEADKLDAAAASSSDLSKLLELDRRCAAAHLFKEYRREIRPRFFPDGTVEEKSFIADLASPTDDGLRRAQLRIEAFKRGTTIGDVEKAVRDGAFRIEVTPENPAQDETAIYALRFSNARLNELPLARILTVTWDFRDDTSNPRGVRCAHFFAQRRSRWRWLRSLFHWQGLPKSAANHQPALPDNANAVPVRGPVRLGSVTLRVDAILDEAGEWPTAHFSVRLRDPEERPKQRRFELVTTLISFLIALAAAYSIHLSQAKAFLTFNDYLLPFLWGFGLDQIKDKATRFGDVMAATPVLGRKT